MLKKFKTQLIASSIFIVLLLSASLFVRPIYGLVNKKINDITKIISTILIEKAELKIKYKSLSPSILSSFSVNEIQAYDREDNLILKIDRTKISYNLQKVFTGSINQIVKSVALEGLQVYGNQLQDYVLDLIALYGNSTENKENLELDEILEMVEELIPQTVSVKNFSADYKNDLFETSALVKKLTVLHQNKKNVYEIHGDGSGDFSLPQNNLTFSTDFVLDSNLFPDHRLEDSTASITIDNLTDSTFFMNKLNLQVNALENQLCLETGTNTFPLNFKILYDLKDNNLSAEVDMNNFQPAQLIRVGKAEKKKFFSFTEKSKKTEQLENQVTEIFSKVSNVALSLSAHGNYDIKNNRLSYNSSGSAGIPSELIPGGAMAEYSLFGNDKRISLPSLNLIGPNYIASADLSMFFEGLQVSGILELPFYNLPNGNVVSTEVYIDTLDTGYMAFSPQIFIGDTSLTALQVNVIPLKDSVDFSVEISDYSHIETGDPGTVRLDGSFLYGSKYLQSSLSLNSLFADSLANIASSVLDKEISEKIVPVLPLLSPYMLSADGYVSSDLKSILFNVPYVLLADTTKDSVAVLLSANGNDQSIQVNQMNLVYGKHSLSASASLDRMPDSSDMFFMVDFSYGGIPYHASGTVMPELISLTGDYGADIQVNFNKKNFSGHAVIDNFPIHIEPASLVCSLDADFNYTEADGPLVQINRMAVEETGAMFQTNPVISMEGNVTKYGAQFTSISFTDQYSTLEGFSDISLNMFDKHFDSAGMNFSIKNPISQEAIAANITLSTPDENVDNLATLLSSLYVDCQIQLMNFSLNRFSGVKNDDNEITMSAYMTGPVDHPYVTLNIEKMSMIIGNFLAKAQGMAFIEDRTVLVNDFIFDYQGMLIKDVSAEISLEDFKGYADATFYADLMGLTTNIPFHFEVKDSSIDAGKFFPTEITAELSSSGMSGTMIKKPVDFTIGLMYLNKNISFYSSDNIGLYGSFCGNGDLFISLNSENLAKLEANGFIRKNDISIKFSNINLNLKDMLSYWNFDDFFELKTGNLQGSLLYTENPSGPEFKGALSLVKPTFQIPMFIPYNVNTERIMILFNGNEIRMAENLFTVKNKHHFKLSGGLFLNKWALDHAEASFFTVEKELIPIKYTHPYFTLDGELGCNLNVLLEDSDCNVSGSVLCENLLLKSSLADVTKRPEKTDKPEEASDSLMNIHVDVGLKLGTHAMINFDPLLRCIFVPNTSVRFLAELENNYFDVRGNLGIKSGDISYLNRSFYIKEGNVKFNSDNLLNPAVTIKAETREKDDKGDNVRIIISAENQLLLSLDPKFSSVPSKSESEIRMLLGQVVVGGQNILNSTKFSETAFEIAGSAGDYALQSFVFRGVENKLRNLMNIDIFSVRTNILQNIKPTRAEEFSVKQLLDNSSLYVGRYFGDMLYFDAMVNLSYNDGFGFSSGSLGGLQILPEFGVELELPALGFLSSPNLNVSSNLRWSMAPDIAALRSGDFLPNSTVTLSWKFSF